MPDSELRIGLPPADVLRKYEIFDCYFTPSYSHPGPDGVSHLLRDMERSMPALRLGEFRRACYFPHVGLGTTSDPAVERLLRARPELITKPLRRWPEFLVGLIQVNVGRLRESLEALDRWLRDGPMRGVYFPGGGPGAVTCTHPGFDRLVDRTAELGGVIMQHTWFKTGGKQGPGESTPAELAALAARHPDVSFVCAHAGGEWEQGLAAVRDVPNVLVETSGFDATSGFIERAVREVGAERIVFGSHLPGRSLGTELGKVLAAEISERERALILGGSFRRLLSEAERRAKR